MAALQELYNILPEPEFLENSKVQIEDILFFLTGLALAILMPFREEKNKLEKLKKPFSFKAYWLDNWEDKLYILLCAMSAFNLGIYQPYYEWSPLHSWIAGIVGVSIIETIVFILVESMEILKGKLVQKFGQISDKWLNK